MVLCFLLFLSLSCYCDSQVELERKLQSESWATACVGLVVGQLNPAPPGSGWGSGLTASPLGPLSEHARGQEEVLRCALVLGRPRQSSLQAWLRFEMGTSSTSPSWDQISFDVYSGLLWDISLRVLTISGFLIMFLFLYWLQRSWVEFIVWL